MGTTNSEPLEVFPNSSNSIAGAGQASPPLSPHITLGVERRDAHTAAPGGSMLVAWAKF
jgi:hypothetical protein